MRKGRAAFLGAFWGLLFAIAFTVLFITSVLTTWNPLIWMALPVVTLLTRLFFGDADPMFGLYFLLPVLFALPTLLGALVGLAWAAVSRRR